MNIDTSCLSERAMVTLIGRLVALLEEPHSRGVQTFIVQMLLGLHGDLRQRRATLAAMEADLAGGEPRGGHV